jgi:predicted phosphodiesterase
LRILILSDIHSNLEAFETCMEAAKGKYGRAVCLGDLVGYGPDPNAVVERVRAVTNVLIRGNHDKACSGVSDAHDFNLLARVATAWTRQQLTAENLSFLRSLPQGPLLQEGFQLVHGSPEDEDEYTFGPGEAHPLLRKVTMQITLFGHTHLQGGFVMHSNGRFQTIRIPLSNDGLVHTLTLQDGARYLINPGSIGQPRDGDWRAAFAILDQKVRQVEYYRTGYNLAYTQTKMMQAGLPQPLIRRLELGR